MHLREILFVSLANRGARTGGATMAIPMTSAKGVRMYCNDYIASIAPSRARKKHNTAAKGSFERLLFLTS
jgi:hypothetical protein